MRATAKPRKPRPDSYHKVFDSRKRRVRGLWQRNGHYYANLMVSDDLGRKTSRFVSLNGAGLAEAKADYDRLRVERDDDRLRPLGLTPKLSDYFTDSYTKQLNATGKRTSTVKKEIGCLDKWCEKLEHLRLNKIRPHHISASFHLAFHYAVRMMNSMKHFNGLSTISGQKLVCPNCPRW